MFSRLYTSRIVQALARQKWKTAACKVIRCGITLGTGHLAASASIASCSSWSTLICSKPGVFKGKNQSIMSDPNHAFTWCTSISNQPLWVIKNGESVLQFYTIFLHFPLCLGKVLMPSHVPLPNLSLYGSRCPNACFWHCLAQLLARLGPDSKKLSLYHAAYLPISAVAGRAVGIHCVDILIRSCDLLANMTQ